MRFGDFSAVPAMLAGKGYKPCSEVMKFDRTTNTWTWYPPYFCWDDDPITGGPTGAARTGPSELLSAQDRAAAMDAANAYFASMIGQPPPPPTVLNASTGMIVSTPDIPNVQKQGLAVAAPGVDTSLLSRQIVAGNGTPIPPEWLALVERARIDDAKGKATTVNGDPPKAVIAAAVDAGKAAAPPLQTGGSLIGAILAGAVPGVIVGGPIGAAVGGVAGAVLFGRKPGVIAAPPAPLGDYGSLVPTSTVGKLAFATGAFFAWKYRNKLGKMIRRRR